MFEDLSQCLSSSLSMILLEIENVAPKRSWHLTIWDLDVGGQCIEMSQIHSLLGVSQTI